MFFTIKHLLEKGTIDGLRLIAGESGIHNVINNTNIMDNPDSFDWLMPGDMVITTGYVLKDDLESQIKAIKELSENNCAALAIKTRKYFSQMPPKMIEAANSYNLPILEIPPQYSLAQFSNMISKEIFEAQDGLLQKSLDIHVKLTDISLRGGGLKEIAQNIVKLIHNPLIILDSKWNLLTYEDHQDNPYPLKESLYLERKHNIFPLEFIKGVPNDVARFKKSIKRKYEWDGKTVVCRIMAIAANDEIYGYMVVWETINKMAKIDYIALEKACMMAALDRIKVKEIEEAKHQIRRDFFDDLLAGKIESVKGINSLAEMHGLDTTRNYICMVVKINVSEVKNNGDLIKEKRRLRNIIDTILRSVDEVSESKKINIVSIYRGNQVILFIPSKDLEGDKSAKEFSKEIGNQLYKQIKATSTNIDITIGIGKLYNSILKLNFSFAEAQEVIKMGKNMARNTNIFHFEDFLIYHLLEAGTSRHELEKFYESTVGSLVRHDIENNTSLVETLEQYFAFQGNISEASKELYIHRNTFIYRLDKIKTILNTDLKDAENSLEIQLGLKVMQLLKMR